MFYYGENQSHFDLGKANIYPDGRTEKFLRKSRRLVTAYALACSLTTPSVASRCSSTLKHKNIHSIKHTYIKHEKIEKIVLMRQDLC